MFASQKPLHEHTDVTLLDAIARLMALKCQRKICRDGFDDLLAVVGSLLPEGHILAKSFYEATKLLRDLKMSYEKIDACPKGCMLFRKDHAGTNYCIHCNSSRYFEVDLGGGQKRQTGIPQKILRYLPFIPRIQRLYMNKDTAQQMRWAALGERYTDKMIHPSDGAAWKRFVAKYPLKAGDPRSVAVAISTDGFNPYGMSAATYSCWPVFVIPQNLPPGESMRSHNMLLSMIIPGPKYPGKNMNVYLEPLVEDLAVGWNGHGVRTYDASTNDHFDMYIWYHTSLHDLPARALFCGWCTHGKWPCPQCRQAMTFFWLKKGGKYSCFDQHRQFLDPDHRYRSDVKRFKKGVEIHAPKPRLMTGREIKAELEALVPNPDGNGFVGYGETHQWTHIPCFWKLLPYMEDVELPHNIDVMHTEKNIAEALYSSIMETEKTKDNVKARIDQEELCDRPKLNMQPPGVNGSRWSKPKAPFCPTRAERREILQWLVDCLYFPDGYAANWTRCVNLETQRVGGLKSHDYHVWIERIMPVMIRGYVDEETWRILAELSFFFRQICARELDREVLEKLHEQAPELLCKLEMLLPPGFFNPMQHMILHLPHEASLGGPVSTRWQFGPEREMKKLRGNCGNKCKIEASMAEACLNEEVSNFTTRYYHANIPTNHNPVLRYNVANPEDVPKLSIFIGLGGKSSGTKKFIMNKLERDMISSYILLSMVEVKPYIE